MSAYIDYKFKNGFLLTEENLRKINDIIVKRLPDESLFNIKYSVYRKDSFCFTTNTLSEVLSEDNSKDQKINQIIISVMDRAITDEECNLDLQISIEKQGSIAYKTEGKNRDFVFLIGSDIKDYIKNNVAVCFRYSEEKVERISRAMFPLFVVSYFLYASFNVIYSFTNTLNKDNHVDLILKSTDLADKLNYLIKINSRSMTSFDFRFLIPSFLFFIVLLIGSLFLNSILSLFIITNVFIIGKEKEVYEKRIKRRSNIIWVVIIGLILSVISGIIVWKITT